MRTKFEIPYARYFIGTTTHFLYRLNVYESIPEYSILVGLLTPTKRTHRTLASRISTRVLEPRRRIIRVHEIPTAINNKNTNAGGGGGGGRKTDAES